MTLAGLLADENFDRALVDRLVEAGHDVMTLQSTGAANQAMPDDQVLDLARQFGRAVLTFNRLDFRRLHARSPDHMGIIACTDSRDRVRLLTSLLSALARCPALRGRFLAVSPEAWRLAEQGQEGQ